MKKWIFIILAAPLIVPLYAILLVMHFVGDQMEKGRFRWLGRFIENMDKATDWWCDKVFSRFAARKKKSNKPHA